MAFEATDLLGQRSGGIRIYRSPASAWQKTPVLKNGRPQNSEFAVVFWNCHARKGSGVHFLGRHASNSSLMSVG